MDVDVDQKVSESQDDEKASVQKKKTTTVEYPELDLAKYAGAYATNVKVDRLMHIARVCPSKKAECFRLAVAAVRKGINVQIYDRVMEEAQRTLNSSECQIDTEWMSKQTTENDKKVRYLEDEIQRWRNLSNREKICSSYLDAAEYCVSIGSFNTAISRYIEAKSYAGDTKMLLGMTLCAAVPVVP